MKKYGSEFTDFQVNRSQFRKVIRKIYFWNILKFVKGPAIDFGCGAGDLLKLMPIGSIGFEVNPVSVQHCRNMGLKVNAYDPKKDNYNLAGLTQDKFKTFVSSHVFEHLSNPAVVFRKIQKSCMRLGIGRIIIVVPGYRGFYCDEFAGHITYIEKDFFSQNLNSTYYVKHQKFFPINSALYGKFFQHNELVVVLEKADN